MGNSGTPAKNKQ
jgi:hypothetical protein